MRPLVLIVGLVVASGACAQPSPVLLEACNSLTNPTKRLECLREVTGAVSSTGSPGVERQPGLPPLAVKEATTICARLLLSFQTKQELALEEASRSTETHLAIVSPPVEGKPTQLCIVNRVSRKVFGLETNGKPIPPTAIAQMERDAGFREEIKNGRYDNFSSFAKSRLSQSFKDPLSAQYRGLFISGQMLPVLCGEVNAKNSYGAYVGFRRFYATGKPMLTEVEPARDTFVFERMWPSMCGEKVVDLPD